MITVRNQFESVPAYEHVAGCSLGTWSNRESACALLDALETTSHHDCAPLWKVIAENHDESDIWFDVQDEIAQLLNENMPMPEFCSVTLQDNEWHVLPSLECAQDEATSLDDYPDDYVSDYILVVNDHGNVTCQQWSGGEYVTIWDMV